MSTTPAVFIAQRNVAETERRNPPSVPIPAVKAAEPESVKPEPQEDKNGHLPRSARRELNRLREELGELRGQLKAYKEIAPAKPAEVVVSSDEKPKRENYKTDAEYAGEVGAWSARQEIGKTEAQKAVTAQVQAKMDAAAAAKPAQIDTFGEDWSKYEEEGENLKIDNDTERMLFATSRFSIFVGAYFIDHPKEWEAFKELADDPSEQRDFFKQIEGEAKLLYTQPRKKAAQAEAHPKDRNDPAEAEPAGRTAVETAPKTPLPRPSREASAPGGTSVPAEPKPGSAAWIAARNAKFAPSRF